MSRVIDLSVGRSVVGMLTDRDIVTAVVAQDVSPMLLGVADVMSDDVVSVAESASLHSTLAVMRRRRVRRVPVLAADGVLVGVLAADDLVAMLTRELGALAELFLERRHAEGQARP